MNSTEIKKYDGFTPLQIKSDKEALRIFLITRSGFLKSKK